MQLSDDAARSSSPPDPSALHVSAFGALNIQLGRAPLVGIRSTRGLALLLYLALEGNQPHARSRLATLLWPESSEGRARHNLRQTLTNLRQVLRDENAREPFLLVSREWLQLNERARHVVDVREFMDRLHATQRHAHRRLLSCDPCIHRLQKMIELYRGDFLQGFFVRNNTLWEEWVAMKREQFQRQVLWGLEQLALYCRERGKDEEAQRYLRRQVEIAPWDEVAHRRLMRLLADTGQPRAALAQYDRCYQLLTEELGVMPSTKTLALHEQIKSQMATSGEGASMSPPLLRGAPHTLPASLNSFIGRASLLAELRERLANPTCRLLTLTGAPGVGKSRLALQAAREHLFSVEHGVHFVALGTVNDPSELPAALGHAMGLGAKEANWSIEQVEAFVRDKELMLLLDNFEHLTGSAPLVARLLKAAPRLQVVVTSRLPLRLYGERLFPVPPMAVCDPAALDATSEHALPEAVSLFVRRARAVDPRFELTADNRAAVAHLCNALDGLPLAIEMAAGRVTLLSPQAMLSRLEQCLNWLSRDATDLTPRERTLRDAIAWSCQHLAQEELQLFRHLSVIDDGWTLEAVEAVSVVGCQKRLFHDLVSLVEKGLLQRYADDGEPRFGMLNVVRAFARDQLHPDEQAAARSRYLAYCGSAGQNG